MSENRLTISRTPCQTASAEGSPCQGAYAVTDAFVSASPASHHWVQDVLTVVMGWVGGLAVWNFDEV